MILKKMAWDILKDMNCRHALKPERIQVDPQEDAVDEEDKEEIDRSDQ
jgi:hypothetical protein